MFGYDNDKQAEVPRKIWPDDLVRNDGYAYCAQCGYSRPIRFWRRVSTKCPKCGSILRRSHPKSRRP